MISFISKTLEQLKKFNEGDFEVKKRKLQKLASFLLLATTHLPLIVLIRLIRPLIWIRFGQLPSARIGHFTMNTANYLATKLCDPADRSKLDLLSIQSQHPVCNLQLLKMWKRVLHIHPFYEGFRKVNTWLPGFQTHHVSFDGLDNNAEMAEKLNQVPLLLTFTASETSKGKNGLEKLGLDPARPFVLFHARDNAYLKHLMHESAEKEEDGRPMRAYDYRNSDIWEFKTAAIELANRGYSLLRMGAKVEEEIDFGHPNILDYAAHGRSDFMDAYLLASCHFIFGTSCGLDGIPRIFKKPCVYVNYIPLKYMAISKTPNLLIPKKLWSESKNRLLTFREILLTEIAAYNDTELYSKAGIKLLDNTPKEILEVALEMDDRINGTWVEEKEDHELQECFKAIYRESMPHLDPSTYQIKTLGAKFLRENQALLD